MTIETVKKLESFEGKRNAVLTFLIPPEIDFQKTMGSVRRQISAIKHANKRYQINSVLNCVEGANPKVKTFGGNGVIICAGYDTQNKPVYHSLYPPLKIEKFEYYYDYRFNIERIKEQFFDNIITVSPKDVTVLELIKELKELSDKIVIGDREIQCAVDNNLIDRLYCICPSSSDEQLDLDIIDTLKNVGSTILKIEDVPDENNMKDLNIDTIIDAIKGYGNRIGLLRYPIDIKELMKDQ